MSERREYKNDALWFMSVCSSFLNQPTCMSDHMLRGVLIASSLHPISAGSHPIKRSNHTRRITQRVVSEQITSVTEYR